MAVLMGARVPSRAGQVGRDATLAWILRSWVVMVSSGRVMDGSAFRVEQETGTRIV